ncbi:flagellar biosynthetic protein FliR [Desulfonispora thiosulfatigenes DSM 11270]|uniref:Flagellar biosynthetic protein FliR n=1 Tax=Desulfonispora thiosulfatigenes DSM 11270 TaxID=656914 RepID=A0A1W1UMM3_DESTI|nr:flagellar biosynthetic protein FliR [Desulfonispora thiosulfatigenes]SMB82346.1 flagellar biosynthetic protein FliR [Desulfonispora thiosulfatigenes DSM 11270]
MPDAQSFQLGFLILARITAFMVVAPFFSIRYASNVVKVGLAGLITILLLPLVQNMQTTVSYELVLYLFYIIKEVVIGLILGYVSSLTFTAIRVAGQIIDIQMGFAMASVLDPQSQSQITLVGQFLYTLAIMIFLSLDGHHSLLMAIFHSYEIIPIGEIILSKNVPAAILSIFVGMFAISFKIAAPIMTVLLIADIALALLARTVPQLNVFILGFPIKAGLGVISLMLMLPITVVIIGNILSQMEKDLILVMEQLMR